MSEFATDGTRFGLYDRDRLGRADRAGGGGARAGPVGRWCSWWRTWTRRLNGLEAAGVGVLMGPVDRAWGHRTLHLQDPDGFVVELAQEIPRRPAYRDGRLGRPPEPSNGFVHADHLIGTGRGNNGG